MTKIKIVCKQMVFKSLLPYYINCTLCFRGWETLDHKSTAISLCPGDELRLEFYTDDKMRLRTDCISVSKSEVNGICDVEADQNNRTLRIYTIDGRYMGTSIDGLSSGIYVVNGKKITL